MQFNVLLTLFFILRNYASGIPIETDTDMASYFINPHIIAGVDAPKGYAPYMAAILIGDDFIMIACGGSILLRNLLLTAAHCVEVYQEPGGGLMKSFHAVVGSNNFRSGGTEVQFAGYHIHPEWDPANLKNDIGLLHLREKVHLDKDVQLVALNFKHMGGEQRGYVTGWGLVATRPSITPFNLQLLEVNTVDPQKCVEIIREASAIWWPDAPTVDPALEICALSTDGGKGMEMDRAAGLCYGDSGSPLMSREDGTQIAIASWAFTCAITGVPDMYARISPYEDYIKYHMELYK